MRVLLVKVSIVIHRQKLYLRYVIRSVTLHNIVGIVTGAIFSKCSLRDGNNFYFLLKQREQTIARDTKGGN